MVDRLPRIRACLFDMDGLLIDSEDLYSVITNEILQKYDRPLLPWSIKAQMQGRPAPEVCDTIYRRVVTYLYHS
jgi:pseudouridine-5'-monophosphatase